jgi:hypothetical protein
MRPGAPVTSIAARATGGNIPATQIIPLVPAAAAPAGIGWICPKCGNVYGPQVHGCSRCNNPLGAGLGAL